jgi:hypothetical protein
MTEFTLNGVTYDTDNFVDYGYKTTVTAGTGQTLPRWTAALVDGVAECAEHREAAEEAADAANAPVTVILVTAATKTLGLSDANSLQECDRATAQTITVPLNSSVDFDTNVFIFFDQIGVGPLTITGAAGVSINDQDGGSVTLSGQFIGACIRQRATDDWIATGSFS